MSDPCCALCRHATGVCLSRWTCQHHIVAEAQDEANHRAGRQYNDPTADKAIRNAMRPKRKE